MNQVAAVSILALTVSLSLSRPIVWRLRIDHATAAVLGALLAVASGVVPLPVALRALQFLALPLLTILSLMTITLVAEESGLFELLSRRIALAADGDARRLFTYIFFTGTITGTIFTNDAAVLIFTPLVFRLVEQVCVDDWTPANKLPFYFAVLYVANVTAALVISNPINIIACRIFGIGFAEYALWMMLPAIVSILASYAGLRIAFRSSLPTAFRRLPDAEPVGNRAAMIVCAVVLLATLVAFFSEGLTGMPTWLVAAASASVLLVVHLLMNRTGLRRIAGGIGWDVLVFVAGIFVIANGVRTSGLAGHLGDTLLSASGGDVPALSTITAFTAGGLAAIMNNHPTVDMMAMIIQDLDLSPDVTRMLVFSSLIGGDLGPKMLPTGSLAALMWFGILRNRGVDVRYSLYVKIGVPVTLVAILLAVLTLNLEWLVYQAMH